MNNLKQEIGQLFAMYEQGKIESIDDLRKEINLKIFYILDLDYSIAQFKYALICLIIVYGWQYFGGDSLTPLFLATSYFIGLIVGAGVIFSKRNGLMTGGDFFTIIISSIISNGILTVIFALIR